MVTGSRSAAGAGRPRGNRNGENAGKAQGRRAGGITSNAARCNMIKQTMDQALGTRQNISVLATQGIEQGLSGSSPAVTVGSATRPCLLLPLLLVVALGSRLAALDDLAHRCRLAHWCRLAHRCRRDAAHCGARLGPGGHGAHGGASLNASDSARLLGAREGGRLGRAEGGGRADACVENKVVGSDLGQLSGRSPVARSPKEVSGARS